MDLEDLQRAARVAREFSHEIGRAGFTLRMPTPHEVEIIATRCGLDAAGKGDPASMVRTERGMMEAGVVAWHGLTVADIVPDSPQATDVLEWSPAAVPLMLDAKPEWARELWPLMLKRIEERNALRSTAAKN